MPRERERKIFLLLLMTDIEFQPFLSQDGVGIEHKSEVVHEVFSHSYRLIPHIDLVQLQL